MLRVIAGPLVAALLAFAIHAPAAGAAAQDSSQFPARILAAHNAVRAQAGAAPLVWDPALGEAAAT
jgi:uncharacterized protein YkwD